MSKPVIADLTGDLTNSPVFFYIRHLKLFLRGFSR